MASSYGDKDLLGADEAGEEIVNDEDVPMSDDEQEEEEEEILLQNDSVAHFDSHTNSIFCIAQHPTYPSIVLTGGGDDLAYIFDSTPIPGPPLPPSYESDFQGKPARKSIPPLAKLDGHTDSVNAVAFTLPNGDYALTAGLDGKLRAWYQPSGPSSPWTFLAESAEVQEINWLSPCPHPSHPNVVALGANDGSVWVYSISSTDATALTILQAYYLHTESSTAGTWTPDGKLLATVSEDSSFYVYDPFSEALALNISSSTTSSSGALVGLTGNDQRFLVEGGLYSIAISPSGALAAVGGAGGLIKIIGLPRLTTSSATSGQKGSGAKSKPSSSAPGSRNTTTTTSSAAASAGQAGAILASLQVQSDSVETLSFAHAPSTLLAAGSVDGSIALFDHVHRFAVRRHIRDAHDEFAVVKVEFLAPSSSSSPTSDAPAPTSSSALPQQQQQGIISATANAAHILTSAGMDGVVRRWDTRGGTTAAGQGFVGEWKGHKGDGEGGGVLGFVQGGGGGAVGEEVGGRIVTAGDDGVSLVFDSSSIRT